MKGIERGAIILTKIIEVFHWVGAGLMTAAAVLSAAAPEWLKYVMDVEALKAEREISVYGFEVTAADAAGAINYTTLLLFSIGAVILFALMALVFRNLHHIIKRSAGSTPFQPDNIRRLRETGFFSMAVPVVGLLMSAVIRLAVGAEAAEISVSLEGFAMGLVVLCLTQFFAHGAALEKEVDGLL